MWWDTRTALAVTLLFELTLARRDVEMFMTPEDKNKYYVEEGGSISITCNAVVPKNVTVDLKWMGPSINPSEPQRLLNNSDGEGEKVRNMLVVSDFSNRTAGQYICKATPSPGIAMENPIELVKSCDVGKFNPPTCNESCSAFCKLGKQGAQGRTCDHINGTCLYRCQEGHTGLNCTEKTEESDNKAVVIGVPVSVIGGLIFLAGVILRIWYLRKKNMCCKKNEKKETNKNKQGASGVSQTHAVSGDGKTKEDEQKDPLLGVSRGSQTQAIGGDGSMTEDPHSGIEMSEASQNRATSVDGRTDEDEQKNLLPETSKVSQTPATVDDGNNEAVEQLEQKLEEQRQKYEQDLGKVSAERDDFKGKWEESGRKIDELQKLIVHVNEKLKKVEEAKEEQWQATQHEIEGYKKEIEGYKKELDAVKAERDDFKSKWEETNRKHDQLLEQIANLTKEVNELKETKCDKKDYDDLKRRTEELENRSQPTIDRKRKDESKDKETYPTGAGVNLRPPSLVTKDEMRMNNDNF